MLTWFAQELFSSCVAACVRMVLNGLGDNRDEAQVRQLLGSPRLGVALAKAHKRLSEAGATAEWHTDWNLIDVRDVVRAGQYPIVGVERHLLGYPRAFHAIVVTQITSAIVEVLDPLDGPVPCCYGVAAFTEAWELAGSLVDYYAAHSNVSCLLFQQLPRKHFPPTQRRVKRIQRQRQQHTCR